MIADLKKENKFLVSSLEAATDAKADQEVHSDALRDAKKRAVNCQEIISKFELSEKFNDK
jgi:hypothetical protein